MPMGPVLRQTPEIRDLNMNTDTGTNERQPVHSLGPRLRSLSNLGSIAMTKISCRLGDFVSSQQDGIRN